MATLQAHPLISTTAVTTSLQAMSLGELAPRWCSGKSGPDVCQPQQPVDTYVTCSYYPTHTHNIQHDDNAHVTPTHTHTHTGSHTHTQPSIIIPDRHGSAEKHLDVDLLAKL